MKRCSVLFVLVLLCASCLYAGEKPTVCLNMIVKNETAVIQRCLESVKPIIDYWVIVDTGSTDGTQKLITQTMEGIPGELHERGWVNFAHNRNEALALAKGKGDYVLIIDADETLVYDPSFKLPYLDKDFFFIETQLSGTKYKRTQLINNLLNWQWRGVLHEALYSDQARSSSVLQGIANVARPDGFRSKDPQKYQKDVLVLEKALADDPKNTRYAFYLAQTYKDAGEYEKALIAYENRIKMGGWDSEIFWSLLQTAIIKEILNKAPEEVISSYQSAYHYRPTRAEPLYRLAEYQRKLGNYSEAYEAASLGLSLKDSNDILFVENWIYDYGLLLEYSIAAYWQGLYLESLIASNFLLAKTIPNNIRECVERNLVWIHAKLDEQKKPILEQKSPFAVSIK